MRLMFLAFLLICQLGLAERAIAAEIDPNELVLQRLKLGKSSAGIAKIPLQKKAAVENPAKLSVAQRNPSKPVIDDGQLAKEDIYIPAKITPPKAPNVLIPATTFQAKPVMDAPKPAPKKIAKAPAPAFNPDKIEPAAGGERQAVTWFSTMTNGQRMTITFTQRPNVTFDESAGEVVFKFAGAAEYPIPVIPENFRENFISVEKLPSANLTIRVKHNASAKHLITYNERRVFLDILGDVPEVKAPETVPEKAAEVAKVPEKSPEPEIVLEAAPAPEIVAEPETPKYVSYDNNISVEKDVNFESFGFKFSQKTDAALFERFGNYWLVFHSKEAFGLPNISKSEVFSDVERLESADALVYKFTPKKQAFASVSRERNAWKISFDPLVEKPIEFPLTLKKDGEEWFVNVPGIEFAVDIKDDFTNEVLTVLPSQNVGEGFKDRVVYRDFIIEKSTLGIVLRKITEGSKIDFSSNQLRLTPSIMSQKLFAETPKGEQEKQGSALIDFTKIDKLAKDFINVEAVSFMKQVPPVWRGIGLFALKFYREAATDLGERTGFESTFLSAAAQFLSGRFDKSVSDLERINIPEDKDQNEYFLWLIAAKQELLKQDPRAKVELKIPDGFALPQNFKNYPVDIATALQLPLVETALADNKIDLAELIISNVSKEISARDADYTRYLQGKIFAQQNLKERAIELWADLISKTNSREVRARAIYAKVLMQLEIGKIDNIAALKELDAARILWRGSDFEFDILTKVGELYALNAQYPDALWAYKTAVLAIPLHPRTDEIAAAMRQIYKTAMQKDFNNLQKSFEALTLYYDFMELKPTGREGEYMTIELAERLVGFDLLDEATKVLEDFVVNVNDVEERALITTRIAILQYLNHQPEKALARLETSDSLDIPKYIEIQRKALLIKILAEQGKYDDALAKINRLPPQQQLELRAEIYWQKQDWQNYLVNFNGLLKRTPDSIMKAAISYAMLGDDDALAGFKKQNLAAMQTGKYAKVFEFITQKNALDNNNLAQSLNLDYAKEAIADYESNMKLTDFYSKDEKLAMEKSAQKGKAKMKKKT